MLFEVQNNSCRFEDNEIVAQTVHEDWDASVGVQLDEPRFFLGSLGYVDHMDATVEDWESDLAEMDQDLLVFKPVSSLELLQMNRHFVSVRGGTSIQQEGFGSGGHDTVWYKIQSAPECLYRSICKLVSG